MHATKIPDWAKQRALSVRGRQHAYDSIDPHKTALIVVDMQNVFLVDGQPAASQHTRDIIPNVNRLAAECRSRGAKVVWTLHTIEKGSVTKQSPTYAIWPGNNPDRSVKFMEACTPGHFGHQLHADMQVRPEDAVVRKSRFSAFIHGSSDLHSRLQADSIDTLIVAGVATNVCCESTTRDAMMMDYKVHFVSDGTATRTDEEHNASLAQICIFFADVRATDEILSLLDRQVPARVAAELGVA
jgi:ureidoacrylate peracid hydrolase